MTFKKGELMGNKNPAKNINVRKKISNALKGRIVTWKNGCKKGYKQTKEHIENARKTRIGRKLSFEWRQNISKGQLGNKRSNEFKEKLRNIAIHRKHQRISRAELKLKEYLEKNNINYIHQFRYKYGIADFYLPDKNLIIECNGIYWHSIPKCIEKDKIKQKYLTSQGYNILTLSSEDIMSGKEDLCLCKMNFNQKGGLKENGII